MHLCLEFCCLFDFFQGEVGQGRHTRNLRVNIGVTVSCAQTTVADIPLKKSPSPVESQGRVTDSKTDLRLFPLSANIAVFVGCRKEKNSCARVFCFCFVWLVGWFFRVNLPNFLET